MEHRDEFREQRRDLIGDTQAERLFDVVDANDNL